MCARDVSDLHVGVKLVEVLVVACPAVHSADVWKHWHQGIILLRHCALILLDWLGTAAAVAPQRSPWLLTGRESDPTKPSELDSPGDP